MARDDIDHVTPGHAVANLLSPGIQALGVYSVTGLVDRFHALPRPVVDDAGIQPLKRPGKGRPLGLDAVICIQHDDLTTSIPHQVGDQAGAFIGPRRTAVGLIGNRHHKSPARGYCFYLIAQRNGLHPRYPGVGGF